jgi:hypothetical protein
MTHLARCKCHALKLEFQAPPVFQFYCHCKDCRQVSSKPVTRVAFFKAEPEFATGEHTGIDMTGNSGKPKQYRRCAVCGDFVYATVDALRGMVGVNVDAMDPLFEFKPLAHVWTCEKDDGLTISDTVVQFPTAPVLRPGGSAK